MYLLLNYVRHLVNAATILTGGWNIIVKELQRGTGSYEP